VDKSKATAQWPIGWVISVGLGLPKIIVIGQFVFIIIIVILSDVFFCDTVYVDPKVPVSGFIQVDFGNAVLIDLSAESRLSNTPYTNPHAGWRCGYMLSRTTAPTRLLVLSGSGCAPQEWISARPTDITSVVVASALASINIIMLIHTGPGYYLDGWLHVYRQVNGLGM